MARLHISVAGQIPETESKNMFKSIAKYFRKEKWALVKIIDVSITLNGGPKVETFYFYLFESDKHTRRVDFACSASQSKSDLSYWANGLPTYHTKILRWQHGRADPDIPRYDQIPEEDTVNMLKGWI